MSYNYNRTVRPSATYSVANPSYFTSSTSDAWDQAVDVQVEYDTQEDNFWSTDDSDDDMQCEFFVN